MNIGLLLLFVFPLSMENKMRRGSVVIMGKLKGKITFVGRLSKCAYVHFENGTKYFIPIEMLKLA